MNLEKKYWNSYFYIGCHAHDRGAYYMITKPIQRGRCVGISIVNSLTVKGQTEDANMAGGEDTYEFRKVDGKWTWLHLLSTIS